jgi:hypothetical protein
MRTTLTIDDQVLDVARSIAHLRKISLGEALSELARKGMNAPVQFKRDPDTGFLTFDIPEGSIVSVTSEDIKRMEEEDDLERYQRSLRPGARPAIPETGLMPTDGKKVNDKR